MVLNDERQFNVEEGGLGWMKEANKEKGLFDACVWFLMNMDTRTPSMTPLI